MAAVPLHVVVLAEAREVLCELRGNRRFGYLPSFVSVSPVEHPLVENVKHIREVVRASMRKNGYEFLRPDALADALDPFLRIIQSRDTSGNITGAALLSLDRIITAVLSLPKKASVSYASTMESVMVATASCKFDASDPAKDEVVSSRIIRVIAHIACHEDVMTYLSDAALLQGFQACLAIAAGRGRASDLSKRVAYSALADMSYALAANLLPSLSTVKEPFHQGSTADTSSSPRAAGFGSKLSNEDLSASNNPTGYTLFDFDSDLPSPSSLSIANYVSGGFYGNAFDIEVHAQSGPATVAAIATVFDLACKLADPVTQRPEAERMLGLQLISAILAGGGSCLRLHALLRRLMLRECSRAILRAVGSFTASSSFISSAFNAAAHLAHALGPEVTAFLSALLQKVFPYYISGYDGILPKMASFDDLAGILPEGMSSRIKYVNWTATYANSGSSTSHMSDHVCAQVVGGRSQLSDTEGSDTILSPSETYAAGSDLASAFEGGLQSRRIDPVVREIGLEALYSFVAVPGLLASVYEVRDCRLRSTDVVTMLLSALGGSVNSRLLRRKRRRLRGVGGGAMAAANSAGADQSDEEDDEEESIIPSIASGDARHERIASVLCAESLLAIIDTIADQLKGQPDSLNVVCTGVVADSVNASNLHRDVQNLRFLRTRKCQLQRVANAFNSSSFSASSAKKVIELLRSCGETFDLHQAATVEDDSDVDVLSIVRFFRETPSLHKGKIGTVLGEPDKLSQNVLAAYTNTFDFADRPFTECLRIYLESFRLPGESQKIDRIVESFANRFFYQNQSSTREIETGRNDSKIINESIDASVEGVSVEVSTTSRKEELDTSVSSDVTLQILPELQSSSSALPSGEYSVQSERSISSDGQENIASGRRRSTVRGVLASADAAYLLSFAVVMLNTDQHNSSIRKKMTLDEFIRNNRGINANGDLPRWFLTEIFESIAAVEIRMSDEAGMGSLTDLHWDEQLRDMIFERQFLPSVYTAGLLDEDIFAMCWGFCIAAASMIFNEASDSGAVQLAVDGFLGVAKCSASYHRSEPVDAVVSVLTMATSIREGPLYGATVRFGTDIKAQMAAVALSGISREFGDWLGAYGYRSLVAYVLRLHALGILPDALEDALGGYGNDLTGVNGIPLPDSNLIPSWWPSLRLRRSKNDSIEGSGHVTPKKQPRVNSLFALIAASIGSDIKGAADYGVDDDLFDTVPPAYMKVQSTEDAEAIELARRCIEGCHIEDILINEAKVLRSEALSSLASALSHSAFEVLHTFHDDTGVQARENHSISNTADIDEGQYYRPSNGLKESLIGIAGDGNGHERGNTTSNDNDSGGTNARDSTGSLTFGNASIISGTARLIRSSHGSIEGDVGDEFFALSSAWSGALRKRDERKARDCIVAFCIDVLCELTLQNRDRLHIPWPALHAILLQVIDRRTRSLSLLERAVVALLRIANRLLHRDELHGDVVRGLNLLVNLPSKTLEQLSAPVAGGVYNIVKTYGARISSISGWHAILSILENCARYSTPSCDIGFTALTVLLQDDPSFESVSAETFSPLLDAVMAYTACSSVDMSVKSLGLLLALSERIPRLVASDKFSVGPTTPRMEASRQRDAEVLAQTAADRSWTEYWDPLLRGFCAVARDSRGKVRNHALAVLEKVVATSKSAALLDASQWEIAFSSILLPLTNELFASTGLLEATEEAEKAAQRELMANRSTIAASNSGRGRSSRVAGVSIEHEYMLNKTVKAACDRTRLRAVSVLSKTFLQHHASMAAELTDGEFTSIWLGVLKSLTLVLQPRSADAKLSNGSVSHADDEIQEQVPECIKNILLVLFASGLLSKEKYPERWAVTFEYFQEQLPGLKMEEVVCSATYLPTSPLRSHTNSNSVPHETGEDAETPVQDLLVEDDRESRSLPVCAESQDESRSIQNAETARDDTENKSLTQTLPVPHAQIVALNNSN